VVALRLKVAAFWLLSLALCVAALSIPDGHPPLLGAIGGTLIASAYPAIAAWLLAPRNQFGDSTTVSTRLGLANMITLGRGIVLAALFGLALAAHSTDIWRWLPAVLYALALIADLADGFAARRRGETSEMGRRLEHEVDTLACLSGAAFLVASGKLPWYFIIVGLARFLFLLGSWIRRAFNRPVYETRHSTSGRLLAGLVMNFMLFAMLPVVSAKVARVLMPIAAIPFLLGFVRDFYGISTGRYIGVSLPLHRKRTPGST